MSNSPKINRTHKEHRSELSNRAKHLDTFNGTQKKGGHGKFNWGSATNEDYQEYEDELDPRDPNAADVLLHPVDPQLEKRRQELLAEAKKHLDVSHYHKFEQEVQVALSKNANTKMSSFFIISLIIKWAIQTHNQAAKENYLEFLHKLQEDKLVTREEIEQAIVEVYSDTSSGNSQRLSKEEALTLTLLDIDRVVV